MQKTVVTDNTWDFKVEDRKYSLHDLHPYPAMMIAPIARRLIKENIGSGKTILDPFCGSGGVLLEAKLLGYNAYGIDINPLALLISRVKTTPIRSDEIDIEYSKIRAFIAKNRYKKFDKPEIKNIDFWFKQDVINDLCLIKQAIDKTGNTDIKNLFLVIFSYVVRKCSATRQGEFKLYRIPSDKLKKHNPNTIEVFFDRADYIIPKMKEFYTEAKNSVVKIMDSSDTREKIRIPKNSVDLIVTSPPYGDSHTTVAYGQFSRLSLEWIGIDGEKARNIDTLSLGGKRADLPDNFDSETLHKTLGKIIKQDPKRAREVGSFYIDLDKCLDRLNEVVRNGGKICFVVGNRTVKGIYIPTDMILVEIGRKYSWEHKETIIRNIPSKRMPLKTSPTNIKGKTEKTMHHEHIVIMEKL
jgi:DNA modification methylase